VIGLIGSLCCAPFGARADLEVSASVRINAVADFHAPLTPYGTWVEIGSYGRCWRPARVAVGWQPYCYGSWIWTDCGWYWASDEPWGWACYHYGTWYYDSFHGWVWVPGIEWAPAWVSWRFGGGYCGWAPLAPHGVVIAPRSFVFVEVARFHEPVRPATVIANNTTIINQTTEVGSIKRETRSFAGAAAQKVVVNKGPSVDEIRKATGKSVSFVSIGDAAGRNPVPAEAVTQINESRKSEKSVAPEKKIATPESKSSPPVMQPGQNKKPHTGSPAPTQPPVPDKPEKPAKPPGKKPDEINPPPTLPPPLGVTNKPANPPAQDKKPDDIHPAPGQPPAPGYPQKPAKPAKPKKHHPGRGNG
jgi:hypothetical protein